MAIRSVLLVIALVVVMMPASSQDKAEKCLSCHGPYEKLASAAPDFKMSSGETVNPHQYIPHKEKVEANIPECGNCHKPHPVPLEDKAVVEKPQDADWCYGRCHHLGNLQACADCHGEVPDVH